MKKVWMVLANHLAATARMRAELVLSRQAAARAPHQEVYRSNAGGWN